MSYSATFPPIPEWHSLSPPIALQSLIDEFGKRKDMITTFFTQNMPEEIAADAVVLYRIAQEALIMSRSTQENFSATLNIESTLGGGTRVTVYVPTHSNP